MSVQRGGGTVDRTPQLLENKRKRAQSAKASPGFHLNTARSERYGPASAWPRLQSSTGQPERDFGSVTDGPPARRCCPRPVKLETEHQERPRAGRFEPAPRPRPARSVHFVSGNAPENEYFMARFQSQLGRFNTAEQRARYLSSAFA